MMAGARMKGWMMVGAIQSRGVKISTTGSMGLAEQCSGFMCCIY